MDTLEIVVILEKKGFDNKNAIKLAEAINGKIGLATKEDIHAVSLYLGHASPTTPISYYVHTQTKIEDVIDDDSHALELTTIESK